MTINMRVLEDGIAEFVFMEKRGVWGFDAESNDDMTEAMIRSQENFLNRILQGQTANRLTLYDAVQQFGIEAERYYIFFGWNQEDEIRVDRYIGMRKIMIQFRCRIL